MKNLKGIKILDDFFRDKPFEVDTTNETLGNSYPAGFKPVASLAVRQQGSLLLVMSLSKDSFYFDEVTTSGQNLSSQVELTLKKGGLTRVR